MNINITARHTQLTQALSSYIHRKLEKAQRHMEGITRIQVILSVEKTRHTTEIIVHAPGETFRTEATSGDLYSAIDLASQKLDKHLTRSKDKRSDKKKSLSLKKMPVEVKPEPKSSTRGLAPKNVAASPIGEIKRVKLEHLSIEDALEVAQEKDLTFFPFINSDSGNLNILQKKSKKAFALIEAQE